MRRLAIVAASLAALAGAVALAACGTTNTTNFIRVTRALHQEGCGVSGNVTAQAGAVNPGTGIQFGATINCPPGTSAPVPTNAISG